MPTVRVEGEVAPVVGGETVGVDLHVPAQRLPTVPRQRKIDPGSAARREGADGRFHFLAVGHQFHAGGPFAVLRPAAHPRPDLRLSGLHRARDQLFDGQVGGNIHIHDDRSQRDSRREPPTGGGRRHAGFLEVADQVDDAGHCGRTPVQQEAFGRLERGGVVGGFPGRRGAVDGLPGAAG